MQMGVYLKVFIKSGVSLPHYVSFVSNLIADICTVAFIIEVRA
jgi:hypothetical protein